MNTLRPSNPSFQEAPQDTVRAFVFSLLTSLTLPELLMLDADELDGIVIKLKTFVHDNPKDRKRCLCDIAVFETLIELQSKINRICGE